MTMRRRVASVALLIVKILIIYLLMNTGTSFFVYQNF